MQANRFLLTPNITDGESLAGYLERLVHENQYRNSAVICKLLTSSHREIQNNILKVEEIHALEGLTNHSFEELYLRSYTTWLAEKNLFDLGKKLLLKNKIKFCPKCIKQNLIHKFEWGLHPVCICLDHGCVLVDQCPHCNKKITLSELIKTGLCKCCRFSFSSSKGNAFAPESIHYISQLLIQQLMFSKEPIMNEIGVLSFEGFLHLAEYSYHILEGLKSFIDDEPIMINAFHNKKNGSLNNEDQLVALTNIFWMYQCFPAHFYQVLNEFILRKDKKSIYIQKAVFERCFANGQYPIIESAYDQFWLQQLDNGIIRKDFSVFKKNEGLLEQTDTIRREEVKRESGMCYDKIIQLQQAGMLEMISNKVGKQNMYIVDKGSFNKVINDRACYINRREAATLLGIQRESIVRLIKEGVLNEYSTPYMPYNMLKQEEVEQLLNDCRGAYDRSYQGIQFHDALIKYSVNGLKIVHLIRFSLEGLIQPRRNKFDGTLADVIYSPNDLTKVIEAIKKEKQEIDGYYLSDLLKIYRIGEKKLWSLIHQEVIVPDKIIKFKNGRTRYLFNKGKVEEIHRRIFSKT